MAPSRPGVGWRVVFVCVVVLAIVPLAGGAPPATSIQATYGGLSEAAALRQWQLHPERAPAQLQAAFATLAAARGHVPRDAATSDGAATLSAAAEPQSGGRVFNSDGSGLPQNEESINVCQAQPRTLLGGTNDYRGVIEPQGNFTGWYLSTDGGRTVRNEGLLPAISVNGQDVPSGGDPVDVLGPDCAAYASTIGSSADGTSMVGVYRSTPDVLAGCPSVYDGHQGFIAQPACWPTRRAVDVAAPGHFLDKDWMNVGRAGAAGTVVWVAYGDLSQFDETGTEHAGQIKAVRCDALLTSCSEPIVVSVGAGQDIAEYPDISFDADGRTYITWTTFLGGSFTGPAEKGWIAVAQPGSTQFSSPRLVFDRDPLIQRGQPVGHMHANDFRVAGSMMVNTVVQVDGHPRVYASWADCSARVVGDTTCEEPKINLVYSDDQGKTWSDRQTISAGGDNYFPSLAADPDTGQLLAAYYTHRFDPVFHNRQDVELDELAADGSVVGRTRVTRSSNEPEADPFLGGTFIGDYLEVTAARGRAYVHFNGNYRSQQFLGEGVPVPQQDNYLARRRE